MASRHRIIGKASNTDEIADVLRLRKDQLQLSDAALDALCGFTAGHAGKLLGPTRTRGLARFSLDTLAGALGVSFLVVVDPEKMKLVEKRHEKRRATAVHIRACRLSKTALSQAQLEIFAALGKKGGTARAKKLTKAQRSRIARAAANAMHSKRRALVTGKAA
jgi:hypothetical protein